MRRTDRLAHSCLLQVSLDYEDDGRSMSSETRARVEEEVRGLVQSAYERWADSAVSSQVCTVLRPDLLESVCAMAPP
jgi:hypothetical protein